MPFKNVLTTVFLLSWGLLIHTPSVLANPQEASMELETTVSAVVTTLKQLEQLLASNPDITRQGYGDAARLRKRLRVLGRELIRLDNVIQADFALMGQKLPNLASLKALGKRHQQTQDQIQWYFTTLLEYLREMDAIFHDQQALQQQTQQVRAIVL